MRQAARKIKEWRENPCKFVSDNFGVEPDRWQEKALQAFASPDPDKKRISMQACVGPGKSAVEAWMNLNFISCYGTRDDHPKGAVVAVTWQNLQDNLWPEISKWQSRSEWLKAAFTWTKTRFFSVDHPETRFISARSYSKTADAEAQGRTLSGLHSKFTLATIDESGEVPPAVLKAAEQTLSTNPVFGKIIQAGNPTSHDGMLYAAAKTLRHLWHIIRITGDPDDPDRSPRIDIDWAKEQIQTYGRDNPWIMSSILGLFPPSSINTLLGPDDVHTAMQRHVNEDAYGFSQKRIGVDVARFGDDRTVLFPRQGIVAFRPAEMRNARSPDIAARVIKARNDWAREGTKDVREFVDGTGGYGSGVIDAMIQAGYSPLEVQFAGKAIDERYANKRAEMWFEMAEWIKTKGCLPNDPDLAKELVAPTYTFLNGKLQLEPKEQIKRRLSFSPDKADALALTFAIPDQPAIDNGHPLLFGTHTQKALTEYDPLADDRL